MASCLLTCLKAFVGEATGTCGFLGGEIFQLEINVFKFRVLFLHVSVLMCCGFEDSPRGLNSLALSLLVPVGSVPI